jgi:hypothetical protein
MAEERICPHCNQVMKTYNVDIMSSDSWSGKDHLRTESFDTLKLADDYITEYNSRNTADQTPEYYQYAQRANY